MRKEREKSLSFFLWGDHMEEHFKGIVPEERWKNEILIELRSIRQLLELNAQKVKSDIPDKAEKRPYRRKGVI